MLPYKRPKPRPAPKGSEPVDVRRKFTLPREAYLRLAHAADVDGLYISEVMQALIMEHLPAPPEGYKPKGRRGARLASPAASRSRAALARWHEEQKRETSK